MQNENTYLEPILSSQMYMFLQNQIENFILIFKKF